MSNFTFQIVNEEDGSSSTVQFNSETWLDAFPKFLAVCRGSGFIIPEGVALYSPMASREHFGDRDFLIFQDELIKNDCCKCSNPEHTKAFYDTTRNR